MAKKKRVENYQHKIKCPKCGKRKVFVSVDDAGYIFSCKTCGHTWKV